MRLTKYLSIALIGSVLSSCSESEKFPKGDPAAKVSRETRGHRVPYKVIMGQAGQFNWVQRALGNFKRTKDDDLPSEFAQLPVNPTCKFPPPGEGDKLVNVHVANSKAGSTVYAISKHSIASRAERFIGDYTRHKGNIPYRSHYIGGDRISIVNVVVTEQQKPVYLVLSGQSGIIWNIQKHPNAKISRVAMINYRTSGIANLDENVPVTALIGPRLKGCKAVPRRMPQKHWSFVKNAYNSGSYKEIMAKNIKASKDYSKWFYKNFKQGSETRMIGDNIVSSVLVGPMPTSLEARIPYKSLKGVKLRLSPQDYVFASSNKQYRTKNLELVKALATEMSGGSLKALLPGS